jgi:hypothetical protein
MLALVGSTDMRHVRHGTRFSSPQKRTSAH